MSLSEHDFAAGSSARQAQTEPFGLEGPQDRPTGLRFLNAFRGAASPEPLPEHRPAAANVRVVPFPLALVHAADVAPIAPVPAPAPVYKKTEQRLKRLFDLTLVVAAAPLWISVVLFFALVVFLRDGHNPFYMQERVGRDGRVFRMLKLRSMVPNADARLEDYLASNPEANAEWQVSQKLKRDPRITRVGRFIRKCSIDELPQLVNVLKGDMSLVGPRPFMLTQVALYRGRRYYDLRPGLTGFWQISNRNDCSFEARAHFDAAYHRTMSVRTDIAVLIRTVGVVLRGTGY